jgi:hypothetical protein
LSIRRAARSLLTASATVLCAGACALAFDLDPLDNGQCAPAEKGCDGRCVSIFSPRTGCAQSSCAPCLLANAIANCNSAGQCAIAACKGDYDDCDKMSATGCEVDLGHDPLHCGSCGANPCNTPHGQAGCSAHHCATGGCSEGFGDCNDRPEDGCETNVLESATDCGKCRHPCLEGQQCQTGRCVGLP